MRLSYFIIFAVVVYFLQFLVFPLLNVHFNIFIPFALSLFLFEKKISRVIIAAVIFNLFGGLPFPLMTISLLLTFAVLLLLYNFISEDSGIMKVIVVLPLAVIFYWSFVFLIGTGLGFLWKDFTVPFSLIFNVGLAYNVLCVMGVGAVFYAIFKKLVPETLIYA